MGLFASIKRNSIGKDGGPPSADGFANEETRGIMKGQGLTRNESAPRRPPAVVAEAWQACNAMKRQHAEDLKREEAEICRLGKLHKAAQKEKDKAGKAFDNAVENVEKATKLAEKHATDGKVDDVAAGLAKANAELEAHRRELEAAQAQGQTSAEQLRRAKVEKEVHDRDRAVELDAAVPRDPFTKRRGPVFQVPANGMGGIC